MAQSASGKSGLSSRAQSILMMIALFLSSIAATQLPQGTPQWLVILVGLTGVAVVGIKEILGTQPGQ